MPISRETFLHTAELARLDLTCLTHAETTSLHAQLERILEHVAQLEKVDTTGVAPTVHPVTIPMKLRPDLAAPTPGAEAIVANAPVRDGHYFVVPRVVGGGADDE